jgi:hypothetical protein
MQQIQSFEDFAGWAAEKVYPWQIPSRIHQLVYRYLSFEQLSDRLEDLPQQFITPRPRPWAAIDWHDLDRTQVVGMPLEIFLNAIVGAVAVETPIREYASVSWHYLEQLHAQMATFVGGTFDEHDQLIELGLWEKEERQHGPALSKIYSQLTGEKLVVQAKSVKRYQPSDDPREDLFRHGLHRVITEYGATCLYLWLIAHSTGTLQQVLAELLQDEINHMTKFWGFGMWAYPDSYGERIGQSLQACLLSRQSSQSLAPSEASTIRSTVELIRTFGRVMELMNWSTWPVMNQAEVVYTFAYVLNHLLRWTNTLTREYLVQVFGD